MAKVDLVYAEVSVVAAQNINLDNLITKDVFQETSWALYISAPEIILTFG